MEERGRLQGCTAPDIVLGGQSTATAIGLLSLVFSTSMWKIPSQKTCLGFVLVGSPASYQQKAGESINDHISGLGPKKQEMER